MSDDYQRLADLLRKPNITLRDLDLDAFADGVIAQREGKAFHENPDGIAASVKRFSWGMGWNERALQRRD